MRRSLSLLAVLTAVIVLASSTATSQAQSPPGPISGVDRSTFDTSVRAQDDFFRHVNGAWIEQNEIPADKPLTGSFSLLRDKSEADTRVIIEEVAAAEAEPGTVARKVGDLYASFMNQERAERLGLDPIADKLAEIAHLDSKADLIPLLARYARLGVRGAFGAYVDTDAKQADRYIVYLSQAGLGLPDESYYREDKHAELRQKYVDHITRTLELAGIAAPRETAGRIMALETRLAANHWDRVKNRDDTLTYNKKTRDELATLTPGFDWTAYIEALGADDKIAEVVVRQPSYFEALAKALDELPLDDWKAWLTWNLLRSHAPLLSTPLVDENFDFYGRTLSGIPENRPRWKRGVDVVEGALGEAVGKLYVEKHFPPEAKARMQELVANLIAAYRQSIQSLDWMSDETRQKALTKLEKFTPKIGYPDKWRDYSALVIKRDDLVGNFQRSSAFETDRQLAKLGGPVDRSEWLMTPQTVNAYYNPGMNEIVFPAAILQPPFFDMNADDAVNYGGIGAVIGHEIGHGFDDQGSKYDGDGNLNNWWTDSDRAEFEKRANALIAQYNKLEPAQLPGQTVNGALTIGENIGDLGGLSIAFKAYLLSLNGQQAPVLDKLTGPQRLFIGWAQVWRSKYRDAELQRRLSTDPHSPPEFRVNAVLKNLPEFHAAFEVNEGDKLHLPADEQVRIW